MITLKEKEESLRRKYGIRTERSEQKRAMALDLMLAECVSPHLLYVCVQNSFDADRQRRVGAHGLAARFVYVFKGVGERESRG